MRVSQSKPRGKGLWKWDPRRKDPLFKAFKVHRGNAKRCSIKFELTFEQWLKIWTDSGHLHERGREQGQYNMCRKGDKGGYTIGNVRIDTNRANAQEAHIGRVFTKEWRENISRAMRRVHEKNCN